MGSVSRFTDEKSKALGETKEEKKKGVARGTAER
jgi:hypothetical protein